MKTTKANEQAKAQAAAVAQAAAQDEYATTDSIVNAAAAASQVDPETLTTEEDAYELSVNSDKFEKLNLARDIAGGGKGFCSMIAEDFAAKKTLFNATSNPEKISSMIGKQLDLMHFFVEIIQVVSEQSGEICNVPRVVLIDKTGKGYQGVSIGLYNAVKRIVSMFGMPDTWESPLTVEVQQIELKNGRTFNLIAI